MKHNRRLFARRHSAFAALTSFVLIFGGDAAAAPDLSGVWWTAEYHAKLQLTDGGDLPLTAKGMAAYDANRAGLKDGSRTDAARKFCVPDGLPRVLASPYPFEIVQARPEQIIMLHELNHQIRAIDMDEPMMALDDLAAFPFYNGHSAGHFEGDTLVVQSNGFSEKTFLDATGAPHTDRMVVTERIRKIGPTRLEDVATIHDPDYYARDFSARFVYTLRNDVRLEDYLCGEQHRDISQVKGVRRP